MQPISYWFYLGTIYLIFLSFKDFYSSDIDEKYNFLLLGITISLLTHLNRSFWYILGISLFVGFFSLFLTKIEDLDKQYRIAINWSFLGFGWISFTYLGSYAVILAIFTAFYYLLKKFTKTIGPTPFMMMILLSFFVNSFIIGGYLI